MEPARRKTDGASILSSLLINIIVFSLAFVYVASGPSNGSVEPIPELITPLEVDDGIAPPAADDAAAVAPDDGVTVVPDPAEVLAPPADFVAIDDTASAPADKSNYDYPKFKQIFDSYQLTGENRGKEYIVTVKLDIDANGQLESEPKVVVSCGTRAVDEETVRRLQRVRFTPAVNTVSGKAVAAEMTTRIFWFPGGR